MRTTERVKLIEGDCLAVLPTLEADSFHACVTDPPYHLTSMVQRLSRTSADEVEKNFTKTIAGQGANPHAAMARGFMGKAWDGGDVAFRPETWAEVLRVLKPGAHLLAFGGTRTYHRLVCAIEDAGFEIRDAIMWHYSTGFPKSHSVNKALGDTICRCGEDANRPEAQRDLRSVRDGDVSSSVVVGAEQGQVLLSPLPEPRASGDGIELACEARASEPSMEGRCDLPPSARELCAGSIRPLPSGIVGDGEEGWLRDGAPASDGPLDRSPVDASGMRPPHRPQAAEQLGSDEPGIVAGQPEPQNVGAWPNCRRCGKPRLPPGLGTALKPATEIICVARKPLIGTVAANVQAHGCGALNIDGCRVPAGDNKRFERTPGNVSREQYRTGTTIGPAIPVDYGRWPANLILSYPEDEYLLRPDITTEQRQELFRWLSENP